MAERKQRPAVERFVSYLRVSTEGQGQSGLGLEAQRKAVSRFVRGQDGRVLREYVEVESAKRSDRPQLRLALDHAKATGATLVIAKLDRLSRNVAFIANLMDSGVDFVAADMPMANRLTVHVLAAVAEHEREMIGARTKAALNSIKDQIAANGSYVSRRSGNMITRLGNPHGAKNLAGYGNGAAVQALQRRADEFAADVLPIIDAVREDGHTSLQAIARELNVRGILTPRGGEWTATSVRNVLLRINKVPDEERESA
jgi:DNA invertase Pin-like site-specific DNA recombinase